MDKTRKQRLIGLLGLFLISCLYVAWTERPRIQVHYSPTAVEPVHYSYKENDVEVLRGEIRPGEVKEYPVTLRQWVAKDYRIAFQFNRGDKQFASFIMKPGWSKLDLYLSPGLIISTESAPPGMVPDENGAAGSAGSGAL